MISRLASYFAQIIGVIFTLAILAWGFGLFDIGKVIFGSVESNYQQQARLTVDAQYSAYDGQTVSGSNVLTAMRRYSNKQQFYVYIVGSSGASMIGNPSNSSTTCRQVDYTTSKVTGTTVNNCDVTLYRMEDETSGSFIPPQSNFKSTLVRDMSNNVVGLLFKQQN